MMQLVNANLEGEKKSHRKDAKNAKKHKYRFRYFGTMLSISKGLSRTAYRCSKKLRVLCVFAVKFFSRFYGRGYSLAPLRG